MKKVLIVVVLAMSIALLSTQAALADNHVITHDDIVSGASATISQGDSVTFQFFWYAGSPGLVREFVRCSNVTMGISHEETADFSAGAPATDAYWGPVQLATPEFVSSMFTWANDHAKTPVSLAYWQMPLPTAGLPAGDYRLSWNLGWSHPTVDLGDWDGDARLDHYPATAMGGAIVLHIVP